MANIIFGMWVFIIFGFVIGTVLGSFVKVLADRSLDKRTFTGRSSCQHCHKQLVWYDLIPIFSYLSLQGKCRYCHKKIGREYFLIEILMGLLVATVLAKSSLIFPGLDDPFRLIIFLSDLGLQIFFATTLIVLALTDYRQMIIPDRIIIPAILGMLIYQIIDKLIKVGYLYYFLNQTPLGRLLLPPYSNYFWRHTLITIQPLLWQVANGLIIGGFFWLLIMLTRGRGMGGGDVKLGAFLGLALGFPNSLVAVIVAFTSGALVSLGLIIFGKKHFGQTIPFGPFLVFGGILALLLGPQLIDWYFQRLF